MLTQTRPRLLSEDDVKRPAHGRAQRKRHAGPVQRRRPRMDRQQQRQTRSPPAPPRENPPPAANGSAPPPAARKIPAPPRCQREWCAAPYREEIHHPQRNAVNDKRAPVRPAPLRAPGPSDRQHDHRRQPHPQRHRTLGPTSGNSCLAMEAPIWNRRSRPARPRRRSRRRPWGISVTCPPRSPPCRAPLLVIMRAILARHGPAPDAGLPCRPSSW